MSTLTLADHKLAIARSAGMKRLDAKLLPPTGDGALDDVPREEDFKITSE